MGWGEHHLDAYDPDIGKSRTFTPDKLQKARGRSLTPGYRFHSEEEANKMINDKLHIDDFLFAILDEYDGFKFKSTLNEKQLKIKMAEYALACLHDSKLRQEAFEIINSK